jgi:hypothetical protein
MSLRQKYVEILSAIVPAGVVGVSLLLGSTAPSAASENSAAAPPSALGAERVSERLAAIREAVSAVAEAPDAAASPDAGNLRLAWGNWWRNGGWGWGRPWGGWGWPNWNNWHNWNNWRNWWNNW